MKKFRQFAGHVEREVLMVSLLIFVMALIVVAGQMPIFAQTDGDASSTAPDVTTPSVPASPSNLTATLGPCDSGTVNLVWPAVTDATGYRVYREATMIYDGTALTYSDVGPATGTAHMYRVTSYNSAGESGGVTASASAPMPCQLGSTTGTVPAAPTGLTVAAVPTSTSVPLHWTDNATNEDKFNIDRKISTDSTFASLVQLPGANITSYVDNTVAAGTTYDYRVQACLSGTGCSDYATLSGVAVPAAGSSGTVPSALSAIYATSGCNYASLSWPSVDGATSYKIYKSGNLLSAVTSLTYYDSGLAIATANYYSIYAVNSFGTSPVRSLNVMTSSACGTTLTSSVTSGSGTIPLAPTALAVAAAPTATSISIRWTDNATNEDHFMINRKLSTGSTFLALTDLTGANITTYTDSTVQSSTSYDYQVAACLYGTGCSAYATLTGIVTPAVTTGTSTLPATPSGFGLGAASTPYSISLLWAMTTANQDKFNIDRKISSNTTYASLIQLTSGTLRTFTDTTVTPGNSYDYRIQACLSGLGCSGYSYLSTMTPIVTAGQGTGGGGQGGGATTASVPSSPSNLSASAKCNSISLVWQAVSGSTSYKVYRNSTMLGSTTTPAYVDGGLALATNYFYTVYAVNLYGTSPATSMNVMTPTTCQTTASVTTSIPKTPNALMQTVSPTASSIAFKWTNVATNADKLNIEKKLSTATAYTFLAQITSPSVTSYIDYAVSPYVTYDYGVQSCLSGTGCSDYAILGGAKVMTTAQTHATTTAANTPIATSTVPVVAVQVPTTATSTTKALQNAVIPTPAVVPMPVSATSSATTVVGTTTFTGTNASSTTESLLVPLPAAPTLDSSNIQTVSDIIASSSAAVSATRQQLLGIIDEDIADALKNVDPQQLASSTEKLQTIRASLLAKIDASLQGLNDVTPDKIESLTKDINNGFKDISLAVGAPQVAATSTSVGSIAVTNALGSLSSTIESSSNALQSQGGDLVFKDSNKDGISDYDSTHIYHIDPVKPSPVSVIGGKKVDAGAKILLGYDPSQAKLVKVTPEEPSAAPAPVISAYKVSDISLTADKNVAIKGLALPNSFVTVYIYSTPIIVTVKTNSDGEWQYLVDKELDNGQHTVYTATVNDSGKIIARSSGYAFVKSAEAATLVTATPPIQVATETSKPTLFSDIAVYAAAALILLVMIVTLYFIGRGPKPQQGITAR